MTAVVVRLTRGEARNWHRSLANHLRSGGAEVEVVWHHSTSSALRTADLLRTVESRLFSLEVSAAGKRLADQAFDGLSAPLSKPDLILDCTGRPVEGADTSPVLQPVFNGSLQEGALQASLLDHRPPHVGWRRASDGAMLAEGRTALVSPHILTQGLDHALGRLVTLAGRALEQHARTEDFPILGAGNATAGTSLLRTGGHVLTEVGSRLLSRLARRPGDGRQWNTGWRALRGGDGILDSGGISGPAFRWLPKDPARFVADPFPIDHQGRTRVFVEELPFATWKGIISVFEIDAHGEAGPLRPVLERPYHLSYPAVFEDEGVFWMMPETGANRTIEIYRADPFPDRWVLDRVLIQDIDAADATFFRHGGLCWIAAATYGAGASSWDSLSLFFAERLQGPWQPHPLNPVVTDPARARPAGWLASTPAGLLRPTQDCVGGYGAALTINRITRLDRDTFIEDQIARVPPPVSWNAAGLHTVNTAGGYEVIDAIL